MEVRDGTGRNFLPKSRKSCALLALISLAREHSVSRREAAATLWSGLDQTTASARLRNTLYMLQKELGHSDGGPLIISQTEIAFAKSVIVDIGEGGDTSHEFLIDLEGIDPLFDRWLSKMREGRRRPGLGQSFSTPNSIAYDRVSLALIDFQATGTENDRALALALTLTEAVGESSSKLRWMNLILRDVDGKRLCSTTSDMSRLADYALFGSLHQDGHGCRLSVQVVSFKKRGAVVWASKFDLGESPSLAGQDKVANAIAARLDVELLLFEADLRNDHPPRDDTDGLSYVLQALPSVFRLERVSFLMAGHILEHAILTKPASAIAHSWLAYWNIFFVGQGWAPQPFQAMKRASKCADRAMLLDSKDARAATIAGHVRAYLHHRLDQAHVLHELALQINPALALAWHFSGVAHAYGGQLNEAFTRVTHCLELVPDDPHAFFAESALGIVHLLRHEHEKALTITRRVTERHPYFTSAHKHHLAVLGHLGRTSEAKSVLQRLLNLEPQFSVQKFQSTAPYQRVSDLQHFVAGLRLAGAK